MFAAIADAWYEIGPETAGYSALASVRLRMLLPARELSRHRRVAVAPLEALVEWRRWHEAIDCRAIVLAKLAAGSVHEREPMLRALMAELPAMSQEVRLLADLSDDYAAFGISAGAPFLAEYQTALLEHCHVVVPCEALRARLAPRARHGVSIIEDPYESTAAAPVRFAPGAVVRLCWFGNLSSMNFPVLADAVLGIADKLKDKSLRLTLIADARARPLAGELEGRVATVHPGFRIEFVEWSLEGVRATIEAADLVLLPQERVGAGAVKSHNRLVEAIRAGRFAIASPIQSYLELADCAWVGADLAAGILWALTHAEEVQRRVALGQAIVEQRFSVEAIGRKWEFALGLATPEAAGAAAPPDGPASRADAAGLRLNLGCGDKILPGYVNVDVAVSRAGERPDVICDLRRLEPFATACCDEVIAIHVVEHFWRWEIVDVLREWVRVLRPGGLMVLECPNLISACEAVLAEPETAARADQQGQRSMWALYGDPGWRDPLMCHRWGYTPGSLREVMEQVGLANVRQEPARFKLREPRDMRLVGEKPMEVFSTLESRNLNVRSTKR